MGISVRATFKRETDAYSDSQPRGSAVGASRRTG